VLCDTTQEPYETKRKELKHSRKDDHDEMRETNIRVLGRFEGSGGSMQPGLRHLGMQTEAGHSILSFASRLIFQTFSGRVRKSIIHTNGLQTWKRA
jgi:hypothetical protein